MSDDWFQIVNFAMAILNFAVASVLVLRGLTISREIGSASVTSEAQASYQALLDRRAQVTTEADADRYYDRFWATQALQYEQWRRRLLPDDLYWDWLMHRVERFDANPTLVTVDFRSSWNQRFERRYKHTRFGLFMQRILDRTPDEGGLATHVRRAMRRERWRLFARS